MLGFSIKQDDRNETTNTTVLQGTASVIIYESSLIYNAVYRDLNDWKHIVRE